jgi:hypothetical protein
MVTETGTTEVVMIPTVLQVKNLAELATRESLLFEEHFWTPLAPRLECRDRRSLPTMEWVPLGGPLGADPPAVTGGRHHTMIFAVDPLHQVTVVWGPLLEGDISGDPRQ